MLCNHSCWNNQANIIFLWCPSCQTEAVCSRRSFHISPSNFRLICEKHWLLTFICSLPQNCSNLQLNVNKSCLDFSGWQWTALVQCLASGLTAAGSRSRHFIQFLTWILDNFNKHHANCTSRLKCFKCWVMIEIGRGQEL